MKKTGFMGLKVKNPALRGIFLVIPLFIYIIAIVLASLWIFGFGISQSGYFRVLVNSAEFTVQNKVTAGKITITDTVEFPSIAFESQWAELTVEGWKNKDIPVFFGNTNEVLRVGAATPTSTRFCGQGGRIVMSAHVTRSFKELEDTEIGSKVYVNTIYGNYVYEVYDKVLFNQTDNKYIRLDDSEEELVLYTCYPRDTRKKRVQRCALLCKKVSGKDWHMYDAD